MNVLAHIDYNTGHKTEVSDVQKFLAADRFIVGIAAVAVFLVVIGLGGVLIVEHQPRVPPDQSRPDGVVLAYIEALRAGQAQTAQNFLSARVQKQITQSAATNPLAPPPFPPPPRQHGGQRIQILGSQINGDHATVELSVTNFQVDSPITPSEYTNRSSVPLVRENGQWKIDQLYILY